MSSIIISPIHSGASGARACAGDVNRRRKSKTPTSSQKWWTPLFGMSSEADYINESDQAKTQYPPETSRSRIAPGRLTEEKARRLRVLTSESSSFHDIMYHSAIASRMASDFTHFSSEEEEDINPNQ
ncbi:uncharacterized protein LOC124929851 [Impatiens glandulifera]|uniref:uncharacterized protein LOC124929851 n=1 Tax=Impatiens glandulifera TaxID=253017 RepID=UPI001FB118B7|nr:uncharacterized protein LOC124929851 [Impatiens glandulifera]